jgi:molybdopterin molybdotransferase
MADMAQPPPQGWMEMWQDMATATMSAPAQLPAMSLSPERLMQLQADYTKQVMKKLGDVVFWKIAMRPGRPMAFGRIADGDKQATLFGLPGNPVAVMVTFYHFVRAALLHMAGAVNIELPLLQACSLEAMRKKPGRTEYQRGIVSRAADGDWDVQLTGAQGSGILRSMSVANGLVLLHHEQGSVERGGYVDVLPFDGLV